MLKNLFLVSVLSARLFALDQSDISDDPSYEAMAKCLLYLEAMPKLGPHKELGYETFWQDFATYVNHREKLNNEELSSVIGECVVVDDPQGFLSADEREMRIMDMVEQLSAHTTLSYYKIAGENLMPNGGRIFTAPCGLAIKGMSDEVMVVQGYWQKSGPLANVMKVARSFYNVGGDKNSIEHMVMSMSAESFAARYPKAIMVHVNDTQALSYLTKKCIFSKNGAYGDHLSDEVRQLIVDDMTTYLQAFHSQLSYYRLKGKYLVNNQGDHGDTAPCAMAMVYQGKVVVMQSGLSD